MWGHFECVCGCVWVCMGVSDVYGACKIVRCEYVLGMCVYVIVRYAYV